MGYVGAQRLLSPSYPARYEQLAAWLQDYNDHPDAPAIYRLALARRTPGWPGADAGQLRRQHASRRPPSPRPAR